MSRWLLAPPVAFLLAFFAYPLWQVLALADAPAWRWAASPFVRDNLAVALLQAGLSVLLTLALAVPLAWHHHSRRIPFSRLQLAMHAAPFVLPVFVVVGAMRGLFGPFGWITQWTGIELLAVWGPLGAVVLAHAYYNYGFAARLLHAALQRRPVHLEAAARALGASHTAAFTRVSLPLLAPAFLAVVLLVFLFAFTSFGVVLFLGESGAVNTLETLLYRNTQGIRPRLGRAAVLGLIQLGINIAVLWGYFALRRREARLPNKQRHEPAPASTRTTAIAWTATVAGILPALVVLTGGFRLDGAWSLEPWHSLLDATHPAHKASFSIVQALDRTLFYAFWATLASLALTLALAYGARVGRARRVLELAGSLPLGTSSILIGLGFLVSFGSGALLDLRGSLVQIVLVHTLVAFPFVARALLPAMDQHDARLDDAARLLGAPPAGVVARIHWPLLRPALVVAAGFAVAFSLGDFGASLMLMREDNMSLAVWIGRHDEAFRAIAHSQMLALSGLLMVLAAAAYGAIERFGGLE